jgi:hypothetical protein
MSEIYVGALKSFCQLVLNTYLLIVHHVIVDALVLSSLTIEPNLKDPTGFLPKN